MISMVVPTRNRAYTLRKVLPSYFEQEAVTEIILIDDAGEDDTAQLLATMGERYPGVSTRVVRNPERRGASYGRQLGASEAINDYVLFCDDDEYLEAGYAAACLKVLRERNAGAVSGRRVYMRDGESPDQALLRFGDGVRAREPFDKGLLEIVNGARFTGVVSVPFTNAIIVTPKALIAEFGFDSHYARGNGYREESDYQLNLFVHGHDIFTVNEAHSIHLPMAEVRTGGQRIDKIRKVRWSVYYNNYFLDKYYEAYKARVGLRQPKWWAKIAQGSFLAWRNLIRPPLYDLATAVLYRRKPAPELA